MLLYKAGVLNLQSYWELFLVYRASVQHLSCGQLVKVISLTPRKLGAGPELQTVHKWAHFQTQAI